MGDRTQGILIYINVKRARLSAIADRDQLALVFIIRLGRMR